MIDIKELQIGNKVKYKDSIVEIAATHIYGKEKFFEDDF